MNKQKSYPTDLTDAQWLIIVRLIPQAKPGGRRRKVQMREVLNAIFYLLRSGGAWRLLPHDFPAWQTVYGYFRQWRDDGTWEAINDALRQVVRQEAGRAAQPSAAIIDSQSVKGTTGKGIRGLDAYKKVKGRKRHILVDTLGLLLAVYVHPANQQDRVGARPLLQRAFAKGFSRLQLVWADRGYFSYPLIAWLVVWAGWWLEIVKPPPGVKGFTVLPKRWIVERTFAWLSGYRRLSRDYEQLPQTSEAMIYAAMIHLMLRRLSPSRSMAWAK